jgi:hypothetical protein
LELKLSRKKTTVADFAHLDNMSPEMRKAFRAAVAMGSNFPPAPPVGPIDAHTFDHLNGEEFASAAKADAIVAAGKARRGETEAPKPTAAAAAILKAGALARTPTDAPKATGLAGRIIAAAKRAVRL